MTTEPDYTNAIWVESEPLPDGAYTVAIHYTPDRSISLNAPLARAYARDVTGAISTAEYAAAVLRQLTTIGVDEDNAAPTVGDLMGKAWKGLDLADGVRAVPLISQRDRRPYVRIDVDGHPLTQWEPVDAHDHVMNVMNVAAAARLDSAYYEFLKGPLDLPEEKARGLVADLAQHREDATR
ncbi:hypothetical protein [Glycomyces arizonensis]|uniref:hypothetical protein n=1 Tax=Glycomyces arizonensis TaxID=256035 RepID=UPI000407BDEB|nr:hypothetical protein [Glycomyces arizonensis]